MQDNFHLNEGSITSPHPSENTEVLYGNDNIIKKTLETFSWVTESMEASIDQAGPSIHTYALEISCNMQGILDIMLNILGQEKSGRFFDLSTIHFLKPTE